MDTKGGRIAFAGVFAAENKGIAFGGCSHNIVTLSSWTDGASLWGEGPIAFGTFRMIPISYGIPSLSP